MTSPVLPELITEVDDLQQIDEVVRDAINAVIELYEDTGKEIQATQQTQVTQRTQLTRNVFVF